MSCQSNPRAAPGQAVRGRRRKKLRAEQPEQRPAVQPQARAARPAGWRVIAAKEVAHPGTLKPPPPAPPGAPSLFLLLSPRPAAASGTPPFTTFITFLGPLLGIAF